MMLVKRLIACSFILFAACAAGYNRSLPLIDGEGNTHASAILVSKIGVLTAAHAVDSVRQEFACKDTAIGGKLIRYDVGADLALFALEKPCEAVDVTTLAGANPKPGELLIIQGYPMGGPLKTTHAYADGTLELEEPVARTYLSMKTVIVPGNSGGPVLDASGHLVGMAVGYTMCGKEYPAKAAPTCRGLATPLQLIKNFLTGISL